MRALTAAAGLILAANAVAGADEIGPWQPRRFGRPRSNAGGSPAASPARPGRTGHEPSTQPPWPMPSLDIVKAIVEAAHSLGKRVAAHVGEKEGVALSLAGGVDEWVHVPCGPIEEALLKKAVEQGVTIVTTIDTLSHCPGIHANAAILAKLGAELLYGAEIAHTDIPRGIDAQELHLMLHLTGMTPLELFQTATSKAGEYLGLAPLGTLTATAPADIIAVRGKSLRELQTTGIPGPCHVGGAHRR
ncbi:MAG: amidohydrolase family protein [Gammaproteobacteria bacterium]